MKRSSEVRVDEHLVWQAQPAWAEYSFLWFFASIFALRSGLAFRMGQTGSALVYGVGFVLFTASAVFLRRRTTYRLTRKELIKSAGFLGKKQRRMPLSEIDSVEIFQGPIDRLFGIGGVLLRMKKGRAERLVGINEPEVLERKLKVLL